MANAGRTAGRTLQPVVTREEGLRYLAAIADEAHAETRKRWQATCDT